MFNDGPARREQRRAAAGRGRSSKNERVPSQGAIESSAVTLIPLSETCDDVPANFDECQHPTTRESLSMTRFRRHVGYVFC